MKKTCYIVCLVLAALLAASCCKDSGKVRLLYWNIQNGMWDGQPDNYDRFVSWVKEQDPDICVWCEATSIFVSNSTDKLPKEEKYLPDGWSELAARYGHKYTFRGGERDNYPQVITSKYPIEEVARIIGNEADSVVTHGAGWARIACCGKTLNIVTLHTWPQAYAFGIPKEDRDRSKAAHEGDLYRRMEMEYICKHTIETVPEAKDQYWMMMGDHNARSRVDNWVYKMEEYAPGLLTHDYILQNTPYIDIIHERNPQNFYSSTGGKSRIDFVYATKPLYDAVEYAEIITDDYTRPVRDPQNLSNFWHPSDHRPIIVDFNLAK